MATRVGEPEATFEAENKVTQPLDDSMNEDISDSGQNQEQIQQALSLALKDGEATPSSVTIFVLGQENAGKTCLIASLLGDTFEETMATQGADADVCKIFASKWSRIEKSKIPKKLQRMYHSQLRITAQIKISAEQQKPVLKAKKMQELLDSLPELPETVKADLEQAKTAVLVDEDGINAIIWDFSGQFVYYGLHSMFLKEDSVAMIVFDASQPLYDPVKVRDSHKDPYTQKSISPTYTGVESVCYYLQSIHAIRKNGVKMGATSLFVPTIFLVATHIDLIGDSKAIQERKKEIIDQLFLLLYGKPFAKHIAGAENGLREALEKNCFFISNKVHNLKELDRLRSMLAGAFGYIMNKQHPVVFLNIEKTLLSLNKAAITAAQFHSIAYESGFFAKPGSEESKGVLAHFHSKGTILHFPQVESLKDIVVLSPDWLAKLFSYIIIAHPYRLEYNFGLEFKRLKDYGILEEGFITFMVNKFNAEQKKFGLPLSTEQAIEFAQLFGFVAEVHHNMYFLEEMYQPPDSQKRVFIVPPMLPLQLPNDVTVPDDQAPQTHIVYFKFPENFIPPMVYYQMLSACIDRNIRRQENLYWIRRKMIKMVLGCDQLYYVSLCADSHSIRLAITPDDDGVVTHKGILERLSLIEDFNAKLMETVKAFMPASNLPQCYIPCSLCSKLHLRLDDIRADDKPLHCFKGKLPNDYYSDLRKYQVPTMQKLESYLERVLDWEEFGYYLLPEDKEYLVEEIKRDNEIRGTRSCKITLYRTFLQCGVRTWEQVVEALNKSGHEEIAKEVVKQLLKSYSKESSNKSQQKSALIKTGGLLMQRDLEEMVLTTKKDIDLPLDIKDTVFQSVEVLLVTLSINETLAARYYLQPLNNHKNIYRFSDIDYESGMQAKSVVYYIGRYGTCPTAIRDVQPGYDSGNSVSVMADRAFPNLGVIINVGIVCGIKSKVELFDVLVSSKVINYVKTKDGKYLQEGDEIILPSKLTKLFTQFDDWPNDVIKKRLNDTGIKLPNVKTGTILSGFNIDDPTEVETFIKTEDSVPIGIEKQKAQLFSETQQTTINIIIIKAVYDVVNEKKNNEECQPTAALLAADLVHKCLCGPEAHEVIKGIILLRKMLKQAKSEGLTIKVKHAKILFCGASSAGKTSFCRLLKGEKHETVHKSTPAGHSQQVLLSGEKINVVGSTWISLNTQLETKELTKKLIARLQKKEYKIFDASTTSINHDSIEKSVPVADSKPAIETIHQIGTAATDANTDDASNLKNKDTQPKYLSSVSVASTIAFPKLYKSSAKVQENKHIQIEKQIVACEDEFGAKDIPETWDFFTFLDTGGQPEFINMLPAINAYTAITFIVLNMSTGKKCLNDPVISQYKREGFDYNNITLKYTNLHLLKCLLSSVKVAAMNKDNFHPQIIKQVTEDKQKNPAVGIIGTCADVLKKELKEKYVEEFKEKYLEELSQINEEVKKLVKAIKKEGVLDIWCDGIGNYVIPVNNAIPRDPQEELDNEDQTMQTSCLQTTTENIQKIRDRSNKTLELKSQYEMPISWFILELELRSNSKDCIHLDKVFDICHAIIPKMTYEEIIEVLKFFHFNGMLLYFDKVPGMNEFVITNPQWLFLNLTKIIMCKYEIDANNTYGSDYIEEMHHGICHMGLLEKLKLDLQGIELQSFVNLLVHLKIIAPMDKGYFIPTVLPPSDEKNIFTEKEYGLPAAYADNGDCIFPIVKPLLIEFTFGTIPRGLFGFLIVQLLQNKSNELLHHLYGCNDDVQRRCVDLICFYIYPCCYVSLRDKISYLELQVRVKNNERSRHYEVQTVVTEALKLVCEKFSWQFSDCRYGFLCEQHSSSFQGEHLTLLSPSQPFPNEIPKYTFCGNESQQPTLVTCHRIWFEDLEEVTKKLGYKEKAPSGPNLLSKSFQTNVGSDDNSATDSFDYSTAQKNIRKNYHEMTYLPINSMLSKLFSEGVITLKEKQQIKACNVVETEQMQYFLDNIIIPSLECKNNAKFKGLLKILKESDDPTSIAVAKKL